MADATIRALAAAAMSRGVLPCPPDSGSSAAVRIDWSSRMASSWLASAQPWLEAGPCAGNAPAAFGVESRDPVLPRPWPEGEKNPLGRLFTGPTVASRIRVVSLFIVELWRELPD